MLGNPGLWIDALGGAAQLLFAVYLVSKAGANTRAILFALFFGLNGLAFLLRNLIPHEHALFPLLGGTIWGALNWFSAGALVTFSLTGSAARPIFRLIAGLAATTLAVLSWASAPASVTLLVFGGSAVYAAIAFALVLLLAEKDIRASALLSLILVVNSALHAGVGVVARGSVYNFTHAALLLAVGCGWLFWKQGGSTWETRWTGLASGAVIFFLSVGGITAYLLESQRAVQDSGLYGMGRIIAAATALVALRDTVFGKRQKMAPALESAG